MSYSHNITGKSRVIANDYSNIMFDGMVINNEFSSAEFINDYLFDWFITPYSSIYHYTTSADIMVGANCRTVKSMAIRRLLQVFSSKGGQEGSVTWT